MTAPAMSSRARLQSKSTEGRGLLTFAAVVLGVVGMFNLLYGIAAITNSHVFVGSATYVVGDLYSWGWVATIIGACQILIAVGVVNRNQVARWFGVLLVSFNLIGQMFYIAAYPLWSLTVIVASIVALYALCAFGGETAE